MAGLLSNAKIQYFWQKIKAYIDGKIASSTAYGMVKLYPEESVTLDNEGRLNVGGRLGQMSDTTGVYCPKTINPSEVGNGSLLLTEASGTVLGNKSLAVTTGSAISLKTSASAGSVQYRVANNYANRIICAGLVGGVIAMNEATASNTAKVVSVQINGADFTPDSSANSSSDIIITASKSINPSSSVSQIRGYCNGKSFSNLFVGQQSGGENAGASVVVGQKVFSKSGNACAIVGADMFNTGNGNALFGRQHISRKNRSFLAGTGHDTTNGPSESVAAFGQWSSITATTLFAVGNGTAHTNRKNAFEILNDGSLVLRSPGGTRYKISIDNSGNLVTAAL